MEAKQLNNPYENNVYPNNSSDNNVYPNNAGIARSASSTEKREDSIYTKRLKEYFPFFGLGSALYALFYTFCLYKNTSGITYPFFVIGTLCYFFFSMQKLGVPYKKDSAFYIISIVLLGNSNCLTNSEPLLIMNKCGIFLLAFILMIHTMYMDTSWNFPKYLGALIETIGTVITCIFRPFSDMVSYFDAQKQAKTGKKSYFIPILIGIVITIPVLFIMTLLLASADAVFSNILYNMFSAFNFSTIFRISLLLIVVFFCSYAVYAALSMKNIKGDVKNRRVLEPVIAIVVTTTLSVLYLIFSVIQILYLFIGNMQLPEGYTYSGYARQGFFQLLAVCILNLLIVLICLYLFRENTALKVILTVISGCTFIMILSSALRMLMYISRYNLTFLRIFVLWSLAVIFLLMAGVTVFIYMNRFPLFTYSMVIVTVFYIGLSFAHPDYWIARYNLNPTHLDYLNEYDLHDNQRYLSRLSADAAPILLDKDKNPYLREIIIGQFDADVLLKNWDDVLEFDEDISAYVTEGLSWLHSYYNKMERLLSKMHIRNFNFSIYAAGKYLE